MKARLVLLVLLVSMVSAANAEAQDPPFDWTMPGHLGGDENGDGLIDYANSAAEFREEERQRKRFEVDFTVRPDLCEKSATYTWESTAGTIVARGGKGCRVSQRFQSEGEYRIRLTVRSASGRVARFDRQVRVEDWLVVSIGDSVASGEGNPDRSGKLLPGNRFRAKWESSRCHRSAKAGPAQAALALEAADPQTTTTFVHLACSGAEIGKGLLDPYSGIDVNQFPEPRLLPPQIDELEQIAEERHIDAVLLSIGANDVYFGPIVKFCLEKTNCMKKVFTPPPGTPGSPAPPPGPLENVVSQALNRLPAAYAQLAKRLSTGRSGDSPVISPNHVIIVDYFDPTRDSSGNFCTGIGFFNPFGWGQIDSKEAEWAANDLLQPLNDAVNEAAGNAGWTEVKNVAEAFETHGYCAKESWIVHINRSFFTQKGMTFNSLFTGGFHPNEAGHLQEGEMIGKALNEVLENEAHPQNDTTVVTVERHPRDDGDGDTEQTGGIVLGGVMAALAAATLAASRRRRDIGDKDLPDEPGNIGSPLPSPSPMDDSGLEMNALAAYGVLVENQAGWVHPRVESIEIVDERIVRRRVSVDFMPGALSGIPRQPIFAPIALLSKQVLSRFDLRDEAGRSLPLATSEQNATFAAEHMLRVARAETGKEPSSRLRELCWQIARGEPDKAWEAVEEIASQLEPEIREALKKSERFRAAATTFASNFAVMVEVDDPDTRRVVKLAYDQRVLQKLTWRQRWGLDSVSIAIELPELGDAGSRHLEFARSEGLEYWGDRLYALQADGTVIRRSAGRMTGDAHLDIGGMPRGTPGVAMVSLRAVRSRILRTGPALAIVSAIALTCAWFALPGLAGDSGSGAASILLALPAAFGAFLSSRHSHPLESAMLKGARALVFIAGALAFAGAAALALTSSVGVLRFALGAVALLSWVISAALIVAARSPQLPPQK